MEMGEGTPLLGNTDLPCGTTDRSNYTGISIRSSNRKAALREALPGLFLLGFTFLFVTMPSTYMPVLLREEFDIPESTSAFIISASSFTYVLSCMVSPKLDDMFDANIIMVTSYFFFFFCGVLFSFIFHLPKAWVSAVAIILRALAGFAAGIFENIFSTLLLRKYTNDVGLVSVSCECGINAGLLVGPMLGAIVYTWTNNFSTTSLVPLCPTVLIYAWFSYLALNEREPSTSSFSSSSSSQTEKHGGFLKILGTWQMMLLFFMPFYSSVVCAVPLTITAPHVYDTFGEGPLATGVLFILSTCGYMMGSVSTGFLTDRPRYRKTSLWFFAFSPFLNAIGNFLIGPAFFLPFEPSLYWIGGGFFVAAFSFGTGCGPCVRILLTLWKGLYPRCEGDYTAYITSIFLVTFSLGEGLGNAIGGILYSYFSYNQIFTLFGVSLLFLGALNTTFVLLTRNKGYMQQVVSNATETNEPLLSDTSSNSSTKI